MSISGKGIHGKLGANLIAGIYSLDLDENGDNLDVTTAADLGGLRDETGCSRLTARFSGFFDTTTGTVAQVRRGTAVTNLNLYLTFDETLGKKATITAGLVQSCRITGQIRERVTFEAVVVSQGLNWTLP
jgi:hypothetical protein